MIKSGSFVSRPGLPRAALGNHCWDIYSSSKLSLKSQLPVKPACWWLTCTPVCPASLLPDVVPRESYRTADPHRLTQTGPLGIWWGWSVSEEVCVWGVCVCVCVCERERPKQLVAGTRHLIHWTGSFNCQFVLRCVVSPPGTEKKTRGTLCHNNTQRPPPATHPSPFMKRECVCVCLSLSLSLFLCVSMCVCVCVSLCVCVFVTPCTSIHCPAADAGQMCVPPPLCLCKWSYHENVSYLIGSSYPMIIQMPKTVHTPVLS